MGYVNSVIYLRQVGSCLQGYVYFVGCLIKIDGCLQRVYSVSYIRQVGGFLQKGGAICQSLEAGWRLSAVGCVNSVSSDTYTE